MILRTLFYFLLILGVCVNSSDKVSKINDHHEELPDQNSDDKYLTSAINDEEADKISSIKSGELLSPEENDDIGKPKVKPKRNSNIAASFDSYTTESLPTSIEEQTEAPKKMRKQKSHKFQSKIDSELDVVHKSKNVDSSQSKLSEENTSEFVGRLKNNRDSTNVPIIKENDMENRKVEDSKLSNSENDDNENEREVSSIKSINHEDIEGSAIEESITEFPNNEKHEDIEGSAIEDFVTKLPIFESTPNYQKKLDSESSDLPIEDDVTKLSNHQKQEDTEDFITKIPNIEESTLNEESDLPTNQKQEDTEDFITKLPIFEVTLADQKEDLPKKPKHHNQGDIENLFTKLHQKQDDIEEFITKFPNFEATLADQKEDFITKLPTHQKEDLFEKPKNHNKENIEVSALNEEDVTNLPNFEAIPPDKKEDFITKSPISLEDISHSNEEPPKIKQSNRKKIRTEVTKVSVEASESNSQEETPSIVKRKKIRTEVSRVPVESNSQEEKPSIVKRKKILTEVSRIPVESNEDQSNDKSSESTKYIHSKQENNDYVNSEESKESTKQYKNHPKSFGTVRLGSQLIEPPRIKSSEENSAADEVRKISAHLYVDELEAKERDPVEKMEFQ